VVSATVGVKLLYAAPAWFGFCTAVDRFRLNSFLRRCSKLGYRDSDSPDIDSLFSDSHEQLFDRINHSSRHILQQYLPDRPDLNCSRRSQHHNKTLICKTSELNDKDFIIRIYTNIVINFHGISVTFVAVAFTTAFYEMSLELCKPLSWAAFVSLV